MSNVEKPRFNNVLDAKIRMQQDKSFITSTSNLISELKTFIQTNERDTDRIVNLFSNVMIDMDPADIHNVANLLSRFADERERQLKNG